MEDFKLTEKNILVAEKDTRCDGIHAYLDIVKRGSGCKLVKSTDILPILQNKEGIIKPGKKYVEYLFVDENGELYALNISKEMEPVVKRNNFFPESINNQLT